ncbi:MAG: flavin reductase [Rhodospirillales bacterium]
MTDSSHDASIDPLDLRRALGAFVTGVTVVTTRAADSSPRGFTANSFTSVSLDPPLILVCIAKTASNCGTFCEAPGFAVNVLSENQREVSATFASQRADRFAGIAWSPSASGSPLIEGAVSWFDCSRHDLIDAGDHVILLGLVTAFGDSAELPLAYLRGDYLDVDLDERAVEAAASRGSIAVGGLLDHRGQILLRRAGETWTLPMAPAKERLGAARLAFDALLAERSLAAELTFLYSVFDDPAGEGALFIFRGRVEPGPLPDDMALFPVAELPLEHIAVRQIRSVLARYRQEHESARFGLYIDTPGHPGQVAMIDGEPSAWTQHHDPDQEAGA